MRLVDPTFSELVKEVDELKASRDVKIDDLPLRELMRKLEQKWQPDVSALFPAGLGFKMATGTGTLTFTTTASAVSAAIPHGMETVPNVVIATARTTPDNRDDYLVTSKTRTTTTITFAGRAAAFEHFGITNPTDVTFDWVAFA